MEVVHKRLLDLSRVDYERKHGPIGGAGHFLELLMSHVDFAWLRPLSGMMAEIDEAMDEEPETIDAARKAAWKVRLEAVLLDARYVQYLQDSADLVVDHAALRRALNVL
jgi:hypothetical protein